MKLLKRESIAASAVTIMIRRFSVLAVVDRILHFHCIQGWIHYFRSFQNVANASLQSVQVKYTMLVLSKELAVGRPSIRNVGPC